MKIIVCLSSGVKWLLGFAFFFLKFVAFGMGFGLLLLALEMGSVTKFGLKAGTEQNSCCNLKFEQNICRRKASGESMDHVWLHLQTATSGVSEWTAVSAVSLSSCFDLF